MHVGVVCMHIQVCMRMCVDAGTHTLVCRCVQTYDVCGACAFMPALSRACIRMRGYACLSMSMSMSIHAWHVRMWVGVCVCLYVQMHFVHRACMRKPGHPHMRHTCRTSTWTYITCIHRDST
jgi:hypothetical protein